MFEPKTETVMGEWRKLNNDYYFGLPEIIMANGSGEMNEMRYLAHKNASLILSTAACSDETVLDSEDMCGCNIQKDAVVWTPFM